MFEPLAWRKGLRLSQPAAAHALHVPVSTYRGWESGRRATPRIAMRLMAYIAKFGVQA